MSDALDLLILRYLDGTADSDSVRRLNERLETDMEARHALFVAAVQDVQLREILAAGSFSTSTRFAFRQRPVARVLAVAAAVAIIAGGAALLANRYPEPELIGPCKVVGGGEVQRGSLVVSDSGRGTIKLGGYCEVQMESQSAVQIEGEKFAETVFLERGQVSCEADRGVGAFTVRTVVGSVSVKGTKFIVQMMDRKGEKDMFDKRMAVSVLAGTVLVSGTWGNTTLHAGEEAVLPPPGAAIRNIIAGLDLAKDEQIKLDRMLSSSRTAELRTTYREEVRGRLFDAAHGKLQAAMPKLMPGKVRPKLQAIRKKKKAGPPSATDMALVQSAVQKQTRVVMMPAIHSTADELGAAAANDDRQIAWLLAQNIRARMSGEHVAAFDAAVKDAGLLDREPDYVARAETAVDAAIAAYDPDLTGIVSPVTGEVVVTAENR